MRKFITMIFAIIPTISIAQGVERMTQMRAPSTLQEDSYKMVIRPDDEIEEEEDFYYYPGDNSVDVKKKKVKTGESTPMNLDFEVRLTAGLSKDAKSKDANANLQIEGICNLNQYFSAGIGTGYYHSVGPYATRYIPLIAIGDINSREFNGFSAFLEGYVGTLIGIKNGTIKGGDDKAPNCRILGFKIGMAYNVWQNIWLRASLNYFNLGDNKSQTYGNTAENCLGLTGSLCIKI